MTNDAWHGPSPAPTRRRIGVRREIVAVGDFELKQGRGVATYLARNERIINVEQQGKYWHIYIEVS